VAIVWLEVSVGENPEHTAAYFQHGVLSEALGNHGEAIDSYRMSIYTDPNFLPALTNLALLYAELDREGPCREMVARAVELESNRQRRAALQQLLARFE
jgi:lipopolysaccharide biosynthesis regulator YciM